MNWGGGITALGTTALKEKSVTFGIKDEDRLRHLCIVGRQGSGRGEIIAQMALQDIARGIGTIILDVNGNLAPFLVERFDGALAERLVYLDPSDAEHPFSWNPLTDVRMLPEGARHARLKIIIAEVYGLPHESPLVAFGADALLEKQDATLVSFYQLLSDEAVRKEWFVDAGRLGEVEALLGREAEAVKGAEERGRYIAKDTLVRNLLGQPESKFSIAGLTPGNIVIVNASGIRVYPTRVQPLVHACIEAALIGGEIDGAPRALYLHDALRYVHEGTVERIFSSRAVMLAVSDTMISEADRERRERTLARCGSLISLAMHPADRTLAERALYPYVEPEELERLQPREMVVALTVDAIRARPFFASALPVTTAVGASHQDMILASRTRFTVSRSSIDARYKPKDEQNKKKRGPGGFQDAFKAMFEKRAKAGAGEPGSPTPSPAPEKAREEKPAPPQPVSGEARTETPKEVPEATLRQLLFVAPVMLMFFAPLSLFASVAITEIMYDLPGGDAGREWIEVHNTGSETVELSDWKFFEGNTNHALTLVSGAALPPGGYAIIADNPSLFLADWPSFSGALYDSSFSLSNAGEVLSMRNPEGADVSTVPYDVSVGALGDGATLQKKDGVWVALAPTPGAPLTAVQTPHEPAPQAATTEESESSQGGAPVPRNIFVDAGSDRTVFVGADAVFEARAFGLTGEPLVNPRVVWSFGDGGRAEGPSVLYHFAYPGTYAVVVDVDTGAYSATDRVIVRAVPSGLAMTDISPESITLHNRGPEIDIGGWMLESLGKRFTFPEHTTILSNESIVLAVQRTGLTVSKDAGLVLLYPNGDFAARYEAPLITSRTSLAPVPESVPAEPPHEFPENTLRFPEEEALSSALGQALPPEGGAPIPLAFWIFGITLFAAGATGALVFVRRSARRYTVEELP